MDSESEKPRKKRPAPSARNKVMDYLALRDHSEKELRKKLKDKFPPEKIDEAIQYAKDNFWLPEPKVLSERYAATLHRRDRGIRSINFKLREKGLPSVSSDSDLELEKALRLAETKWSKAKIKDRAAREKVGRFLLSRGFEASIVRKVVYEKL